ncbi:MAG: RecX family transcriptional regulator [Bacilli bacterium]|nr:RecX family transcriptional regulator [Bacilli bacterium]
MIEVTQIIAINHQYKVVIMQDDKEETITVPESVLTRLNIFSPRVISLSEYHQITKELDEDILYEKELHFIDYKMRTISEVKKHLQKSTKDEEVINKIITRLKKNQYVNDDLYVKTYISEKIDFDLVGPAYIKQKLILKGIHYDLIDQNIISFSDEMQFDKVFELIKKETKYSIKSPFKKAYVSIKSKLIKKGFGLHIVESAMLSNIDLIKSVIDEEQLLEKEIRDIKKRTSLETWEEKDKVIQKLLYKGYDYELIKKLLKG